MMKLYGVLVLLVIVSAALGLRCYSCAGSKTPACSNAITCDASQEFCGTVKFTDLYTKGCLNKDLCQAGVDCCKGDLCNGAIPTGSSVLLLLVSSAIMTVFL